MIDRGPDITMRATIDRLCLLLRRIVLSRKEWFFSGRDYDALPESIRSTIEQQQNGSERLISWIQMSILLVFALLYMAAPDSRPVDASIEPVPLVLGVYCIVVLLRLYLSYRTRLPHVILVLSILLDMTLLMALIWSFHIQYMQPPAFYLKSPTLLYVFIFIALRALRFEPGYVLISGLVAAVGWTVLATLAVMGESSGSAITRDYIVYLTSNSVLIGSELDKILSILMVTLILTLAIARARRLLIQSIIEEQTVEKLSLFLPEPIAERISASKESVADTGNETREASILFIDLVSFTSLAENLSADELFRLLNEYFSLIAEPIERYHGVIHQFQGDALLASFNLPLRDLKHANHAVLAALKIQRLLARHRFSGDIRLEARTGINTGVVVGGFIGTADRLSYTVYGDNVNVAARLQELAKRYQVSNLVSQRTRQLCNDPRLSFVRRGREMLRGRQQPVNIYEPMLRKTH